MEEAAMQGGIPLRAWREYRALSQNDLATKAGVGTVTIYRIEHGAAARPSTRRKLAAGLGITPEQLAAPPLTGRTRARRT
jgi:transcriptional regulator with XRE-family HTH domain